MKKKSIGFYFAAITCVLAIITLILLLVYASRGGVVKEGPESNFTIWRAKDYIFGYCELVKSFDHEETPEEHAATVAWESRGLEIMDWVTDDVDWLTGEKHVHPELMFTFK